MATNQALLNGRQIVVPVGSALLSGAPVCVGSIAGVLLNDAATTTPYNATIDCEGVYNLSVNGINQSGNSAVAIGDILYWTSGSTPQIDKVNTGTRFGYALDAVASAATTTIRVKIGSR